ncbi:MAG: hypothetical protein Q9225_005998, partial [Loekoesia sp. 1 TL-2023]
VFGWLGGLRIVAEDEVRITRLTVGAWMRIEWRRFNVPTTAGERMSMMGSEISKWYGEAVWITKSNEAREARA